MGKMGKIILLCIIKILHQRPGCDQPGRKILDSHPLQCTDMEMLHHAFLAAVFVIIMGIQCITDNTKSSFQIINIDPTDKKRIITDNLTWYVFIDLIQKLPVVLHLCQVIITRCHISYGNSTFALKIGYTHEIIIFTCIHSLNIHIGTGCNDPYHFTLYDSFGKLRILYLFTDCHLVALLDQLVQISFYRMVGNPAHGCSLFLSAAFAGQGNFQLSGCCQGILIKHFIKVTQSVKKDAVLIILFCFQVLFHHRCYFSHLFTIRFLYSFSQIIKSVTFLQADWYDLSDQIFFSFEMHDHIV